MIRAWFRDLWMQNHAKSFDRLVIFSFFGLAIDHHIPWKLFISAKIRSNRNYQVGTKNVLRFLRIFVRFVTYQRIYRTFLKSPWLDIRICASCFIESSFSFGLVKSLMKWCSAFERYINLMLIALQPHSKL